MTKEIKKKLKGKEGVAYAIFAACEHRWPNSFKEALTHILECPRCQKHLEEYEKLEPRFRLTPRDKEEIIAEIRKLNVDNTKP